MGYIKIIDTGYIDTNNSGTRLSSGNRANSGTAISLKAATFNPSITRNLNRKADLKKGSTTDVHLGSLENMSFSLRCVLRNDSTTDMALIQHLLNLVVTDGYKALWYDYTNATIEDNNGQLIYRIAQNSLFGRQFSSGEATTYSLAVQFYMLPVHFFNIQPTQSGSNGIIVYQLQGIVLPIKPLE
jgi:hypothetical protein